MILFSIILICNLLFAQNDSTIKAPLPPPPPLPYGELSSSERQKMDEIEQIISSAQNDTEQIFRQLEKTVLNTNESDLVRHAAVEQVGNMNTYESEVFLVKHIDLFLYSELSDRVSDIENYPCYRALLDKVPQFSLYHILKQTKVLDNCLTPTSLSYIVSLLQVRYERKYDISGMLAHLQTKENNKNCRNNNIVKMIELIK